MSEKEVYRCGCIIHQPKVGRLRLSPVVCKQRVKVKGSRCWRPGHDHDDTGRR